MLNPPFWFICIKNTTVFPSLLGLISTQFLPQKQSIVYNLNLDLLLLHLVSDSFDYLVPVPT